MVYILENNTNVLLKLLNWNTFGIGLFKLHANNRNSHELYLKAFIQLGKLKGWSMQAKDPEYHPEFSFQYAFCWSWHVQWPS